MSGRAAAEKGASTGSPAEGRGHGEGPADQGRGPRGCGHPVAADTAELYQRGQGCRSISARLGTSVPSTCSSVWIEQLPARSRRAR